MNKLKDFKSNEELDTYMLRVVSKIENRENLSKEEIDNFCFALPYHAKKEFSFCDNDRFNYLYLHKIDNGRTRPKLTEQQEADYILMVSNWKEFLETKNGTNNIEWSIKEEFKYENSNLNKDFRCIEESEDKKKELNKKQNEIIAYSKYTYIKGLDIFPSYKFPIEYCLGDLTISINEFILFHSLSRHYGQMIRQTNIIKSYFTEDVLVEDIYEIIINLFDLIINMKISIDNKRSIRFIYKSKYYQLYIKELNINNKKSHRLNSFFPIEDSNVIEEIKSDYMEIKLNKDYILLQKN